MNAHVMNTRLMLHMPCMRMHSLMLPICKAVWRAVLPLVQFDNPGPSPDQTISAAIATESEHWRAF